MNTFKINNFDLQQIAESGQCFRMNYISHLSHSDDQVRTYAVISKGNYAEISQNGPQITINCPDEDLSFWRHYFDLNTDYQHFISSVSDKDKYLQDAAEAGSGIRILNQDPWEMIITFILSQQKTIPKIKEAVEALCRHYGNKRTLLLPEFEMDGRLAPSSAIRTYYEFPDASQLCGASLEDLKALKLGYRAKYICQICADCNEGRLNLDALCRMDYQIAMRYLESFYGIGTKVANCICLFGLHHINAFPVDTWIQQILDKNYYRNKYDLLPKNKLYQIMIDEHFGQYEGYGGVMQQYIFYYERVVIQGKV